MINLNMINLNSSNIINEQLSKIFYEFFLYESVCRFPLHG